MVSDSSPKVYRPSMTEREVEVSLQALSDRLKFYNRMDRRGRLRPGTKSYDAYMTTQRLVESWTLMQTGHWAQRRT